MGESWGFVHPWDALIHLSDVGQVYLFPDLNPLAGPAATASPQASHNCRRNRLPKTRLGLQTIAISAVTGVSAAM